MRFHFENICLFPLWFKLSLKFFPGHGKGNSNLFWGNCQMFFGKIFKYSLGEFSNILWQNFQISFGKIFKYSLGEFSNILLENFQIFFGTAMFRCFSIIPWVQFLSILNEYLWGSRVKRGEVHHVVNIWRILSSQNLMLRKATWSQMFAVTGDLK